LSDTNVFLAFKVEKTGFVFNGFDVIESRLDASFKDTNSTFRSKVGKEELRLVVFNLTVLNRNSTKKSI